LLSRLGFVFGTLCVCGLLSTAPHASPEPSLVIPSNLLFDPKLEDIATRMLHRSPAFREQCEYLGRIVVLRVRVVVQLATAPLGQLPCRAQAMLQKFEYGRIEARVQLSSHRNAVELISHELEHVREYVEGANHQTLSVQWGSGVWMGSDGRFETARAVAMGRRVAGEVESKIAPE
jgi:hypothetical protein